MLECFQSEDCPHCAKVPKTLSELGLSYIDHNPRLPGGAGGDVTTASTQAELTEYGS